MKKVVKAVLYAAIAAAVLFIIFIYLILNKPESSSEVVRFKEFEAVDVIEVRISNTHGEFEITMQDGGYVLDDIPSEIVDIEGFVFFMSQCGGFSALKRITDNPEDLSIYGLDEPEVKATISYADDTELTVLIGNQDSISNNYYMQVEPGREVYLLAQSLGDYFTNNKKIFINKYVTPELYEKSALSVVLEAVFSGANLDKPIYIQAVTADNEEVMLEALSFGAVTHIVHGEALYELDQTYGSDILGSLFGIEARDILAYGLKETEIADFGFADPYMEVELSYINAENEIEHRVLSLVMQSQDTFLAHLSDSGVVYEIGRPAFVDVQYDKLMLRWFLSPLILDLSGLTVSYNDQNLNFEIIQEGNNKQKIILNGEDIALDLFRKFFGLVTSASASDSDYLSVPEVRDQPIMTITYKYIEPAKSDDILTLYQGSPRRVNVEVNGVMEFDMKETFYTYMIDACENVLQGKDIEVNW